jgi:single-strand DNA-binding protein
MSINSVTLSGNLGRDPELRTTTSGSHILTFSIAVSDRTKNANGEWVDYTNWVDVVVFGNRAEGLSRVLSKGMRVTIQGKIRYSSWEKDGQPRSKIEVIANDIDFMSRKEDNGGYNNGGAAYDAPSSKPKTHPQKQQDDEFDDIPF